MVEKRKKRKDREIKYGSAKERVEKRGSGFENTSLKVSEGTKFFAPKKTGTYRLDIVPYFVKGNLNPYADDGHVHFERTYWVHRGIGAEGGSYVCLQKTFKKPCPVCEYVAKAKRSAKADPDALKELEPKERQLWRVIDRAEPDEGIQLWDVSFHLFGKMLDAKIRNSDEDDHYDEFFRLDKGKIVKVGMEEESFQGYSFVKTTDIEFKNRPEPLDNTLIEEGPNLDECIKLTPYKELKKIFLQIGGEKEEETEEEEEEILDADEDGDDDDEEEEVPKKTKKKMKVKPKKKTKPPVEEEEDDDGDPDDSDLDDGDSDTEDGAEGGDESDEDDEDGDTEDGEDEDSESEDEEESEEGDEEEDSDTEEDGDDDEEASELSIGDRVFHDEFGKCTVVHVSGDGTSIRVKDKDGEVHRAVDPDDLSPIQGKEKESEKKPKKGDKAPVKKKVKDPFEDDDDADEPKPKTKVVKKTKKGKKDNIPF